MNIRELRKQQIRLSLLRAAKVLFTPQDSLRRILLQPVAPEILPPDGSTICEDDTEPEPRVPTTLMQQFLLAATQPSPLKAMFSMSEMEVSLYVPK